MSSGNGDKYISCLFCHHCSLICFERELSRQVNMCFIDGVRDANAISMNAEGRNKDWVVLSLSLLL